MVRAGLLAEVAEDIGGGLLDGGGTLLTSDEPRHTPFATAYEVTDVRDAPAAPRAPEMPEAPEAPGTTREFVIAATAGPTTLRAVPVVSW
ncbi:hypothetical protein ACIQZO_26635 [Streptomyces sp. NPDC097617]|uniref:hypothetical protein n=1 Tax=Streptomyces sp. NPDC097617 TaxID=3366091 RepID=UPI00380FA503